ncbi:MAG: Ig-like domain-containing protein, partial [Clostridia bacterium]|nr:Ig-like domain-containing protein [Clostridia bacterium]
ADGSACTATRVCKNDATHVETAEATITSAEKIAATCTEKGTTTYTATFDNDWATTQTKDVKDIAAIKHDWNDATYNFAEDGSACTATRVCKNDATHVETAEATITSAEKIAATCTEKGTTTYTATFDNDWATPQTKDVKDIAAINHDWAETTYSFAADGSACTATRVCKNDAKHVETATATIASAVKTPATCKVKGTTTYTATFEETWAVQKTLDVQDIAIDSTNHVGETYTQDEDIVAGTCISEKTWNEVTYCSDCNAKLGTVAKTGEKDPDNHDLKTTEAKAPTCTEIGWDEYVTCQREGCKHTTYEEIKALGHAYERTLQRPAKLADNTWSDGKYIYVCKNNSEHTYEEAVARATYTEYDNIVAVVEGRLNDKSLHPDTRAEIEKLYADNKVALNLIVSEQEAVDAAVAALSDGIAIYLNTYKVTFVVDDVIIDMQTVYYGAGAKAPAAPVKEGFVFTGWNGDYTNIKADIALNATYREGELTLNIVDSDIKVAFGKTKQIAVDIYPENAQVELIFTSADPAIATVDSNGVVKGVKVGATTVTVSDRDGEVKDTVIVYVYRANEKHTAQFTASAYGTFVVNGYSIEESTFISIKAGQEFKFEFIPDNQYKMDDIILIVNGQELSLGDDGYYTISCMNENIMILVTYAPGGIVEDVPNGSGTNTQTHSCWCHSANKLLQLLWKVLMIICKAFGIEQYHYCACGKAHW